MIEEIDYTEVRNERIRGVVDGLLTEMLDDLAGFSSIDRFKWKLESFILDEIATVGEAVQMTMLTETAHHGLTGE